jgi:hypothetical protein
VHQLHDILKQSVYKGCKSDKDSPPKPDFLLGLNDIMSRVQASQKEIQLALITMHAIDINGYVRMLDRSVLYETFKDVIDTIIENQWCIDRIPQSDINQILSGTDSAFLQHALSVLGTLNEDQAFWTLDSAKVARTVAHILFQERARGVSLGGKDNVCNYTLLSHAITFLLILTICIAIVIVVTFTCILHNIFILNVMHTTLFLSSSGLKRISSSPGPIVPPVVHLHRRLCSR